MKTLYTPARLLAFALMVVLAGAAAPSLFAQVTIGSGGFTSTTVCPSSTITSGCLVAINSFQSATTTGSGALQMTNSSPNQVASAWAVAPQTVANGFATSFTFQFTNPSFQPADGIAFVIQNAQLTNTSVSGLAAIGYTGGNGGAIGYSDDDANRFPNSGMPNSLGIEFDSYRDSWDPNANHVAIQSCGTNYNTSHHNQLCPGGGNSTLGIQSLLPITLSDGNPHTASIQYNPPNTIPCDPSVTGNLCIWLDKSAHPAPVLSATVDLSTIGLVNGTAYVGFTAATGNSYQTQDILNWTFSQTIVEPVSATAPTVFPFNPALSHTDDFSVAASNNNLTYPNNDPTTIQIESTNTSIDPTTWPQYTTGGPLATSLLFPLAVDNPSGQGTNGSLFVDLCFDPTLTGNAAIPLDTNCPFASSPSGPLLGIAISGSAVSPKPTINNPVNTGMTTVLAHYEPPPPGTASWAPSPINGTPNPACINTLGTDANPGPQNCHVLNIQESFFGDGLTDSGRTRGKGAFAILYKVPMPLSAASVNGSAVNAPPSYNPGFSANLWFKSPLFLNFVVYPACPTPLATPCPAPSAANNYFTPAPVAGESFEFTDLNGNIVTPSAQAMPTPSTLSVQQVTFPGAQNSVSLADGKYFLQWRAVDNDGIPEQNVQSVTTGTCPNPVTPASPFPAPCYETLPFEAQVNVDSTKPNLTVPCTFSPPAPNGYGWYMTEVMATCTATDNLSGIGSASPSITGVSTSTPVVQPNTVSFTVTTNVGAGNWSMNASTGSQQLCDLANNCLTTQFGPFQIDEVAPTVGTITFSPAAAVYTLGQQVTASFSCSDVGSGVATCLGNGSIATGGQIDTSTTGPHTFTVTAIDKAGNQTSKSVNYTVGDFTISVTPATQTISSGHQANYTITITRSGGLTGSIALTCVNPIPNTTCSVNNSSVTLIASKNVTHGTWTTLRFTATYVGSNVSKSVNVTLTIK